MQAFLPRLAALWHELGIEVLYAQEVRCRAYAQEPSWVPASHDPLEYAVLREEMHVRKKKQAMLRVLRRTLGQSKWKNVLSFGDGAAEQNAIQEIAFRMGGYAEQRRLLVKNVKLLEEPNCDQLCTEVQAMTACLPALITLADDFTVVINDIEEGLLTAYQRLRDLAEGGATGESGSAASA